MGDRSRAKRIVAKIYSRAASRLYEPLVVHGSFRLLGGDLNERVASQGRAAVRVAGGRPILDMPVGTAYFTEAVARAHGGLVVGADIAEGMVREAAARRLPNLAVVQADAHHLPFEDGAFGAILCTNGLQVIPGLRPAIQELARVLAPEGTLFVSVVGVRLRARSLPTMFSTAKVKDELERVGLQVTTTRGARLATLYEARRAAARSAT
jgi:ubiquinone/menaquinone biosynthesis C-methylase UbiE